MDTIQYIETVKRFLKYFLLFAKIIGEFLSDAFTMYFGPDVLQGHDLLFTIVAIILVVFVVFIIGVSIQARDYRLQASRARNPHSVQDNVILLFIWFYPVKKTKLTSIARLLVMVVYGSFYAIFGFALVVQFDIGSGWIVAMILISPVILIFIITRIIACCRSEKDNTVLHRTRRPRKVALSV